MIEAAPNFGSQLGQQLGSGLSQGIGHSLSDFFKQKQNSRALEGLKPFYQEAGLPEEGFEEFKKSGLSPEIAVAALKIGAANRAKKEQSGLSDQDYSGILNELDSILDEGGAGMSAYVKSLFSPELRESGAKFQSLSTATLGLAQKVALKQGIRNQREFDAFLKRTVPNQTDTIATAKGKIEALRSYLSQDESGSMSPERVSVQEEFVSMRDPKGVLRKVPKSKAIQFQKAGGKIVQ